MVQTGNVSVDLGSGAAATVTEVDGGGEERAGWGLSQDRLETFPSFINMGPSHTKGSLFMPLPACFCGGTKEDGNNHLNLLGSSSISASLFILKTQHPFCREGRKPCGFFGSCLDLLKSSCQHFTSDSHVQLQLFPGQVWPGGTRIPAQA